MSSVLIHIGINQFLMSNNATFQDYGLNLQQLLLKGFLFAGGSLEIEVSYIEISRLEFALFKFNGNIKKKQRNGQSMNMERGTLVRWNDAKGFGFIKPEIEQGKEVFIHISILKHMARKPMVGDQIEFEREQQIEGKVRAKRANIEGVAIMANHSKASLQSHSSNITPHSNNNTNSSTNSSTNHRANHNSQTDFRMAKGGNYRQPKSNIGVNIISLLILLGLVFYGVKQYRTLSDTANSVAPTQHQVTPRLNASQEVNSTQRLQLNTQPSFQCEAGKTHCSQMRTCAEATFYIKHCPGTQMDGDNDGVPCEHQHCG